MRYVLGAPGVGKTTALPLLRERLPGWVVLDWDWLMPAVERLSGRSVSQHQELWAPYTELVRSVVVSLGSVPVLLTTVCTPAELDHAAARWPEGQWLLLDCDDEERGRRLRDRGEATGGVAQALKDAAEYRSLGLARVDTSGRPVADVVEAIAQWATASTS
ncbi:AAA family ATPase [Pseudactinotalea terrae]|uniref:AAA family ATPase n=1 Tax=Pseudactinotalea terrae TaxID=1743262 RepID=UPI0012E18E5C|nr:AAA family ATPase [Pseudactinotalea terrae]